MKIRLIISSIISLLISLSSFGQEFNVEAFSDFINDSESPSFNREMIIDIKGDSVAGYAFIANGGSLKETVIMTHGLPGNDNQFDIAQSIRRAGRNVIHFNYRGSWGSQGEFLYSNCLDDVDEIIKYLSDAELSNRLRIDTNAFVLLGRSFGGGVALIQGSKNEKVKKIVAISSMNAGSDTHPIHNSSLYSRWIEYLNKQIMLHVDPTLFMQEIFDNKKEFDVLSYKDQLEMKKVLFIEDNDNNQNWIKHLDNSDLIKIDSDHNFISNRIEVTSSLINWLNKI